MIYRKNMVVRKRSISNGKDTYYIPGRKREENETDE